DSVLKGKGKKREREKERGRDSLSLLFSLSPFGREKKKKEEQYAPIRDSGEGAIDGRGSQRLRRSNVMIRLT
ncbi:unnamed protein product, partial [marine sediment metagenome]